MNILTFLAKNWDSVLVVVAFLALLVGIEEQAVQTEPAEN